MLARGKGQRLLISGVYADQEYDTILAMAPPRLDNVACCLDLDYIAKDTGKMPMKQHFGPRFTAISRSSSSPARIMCRAPFWKCVAPCPPFACRPIRWFQKMSAWMRGGAIRHFCLTARRICALYLVTHGPARFPLTDRMLTFRIWLFAPFVALFALGVGFFFYGPMPVTKSKRVWARRTSHGKMLCARAFRRMTMDFTEMGWQGENSTGRYPLCALPLCRLKPTMLLWIFRHRTCSPRILPNCALTMTAISPVLFWTPRVGARILHLLQAANADRDKERNLGSVRRRCGLCRRARDNAARTDIALRTGRIEGDARLGISRGELDIDTPQSWLTGPLPPATLLALTSSLSCATR